MKTNSRTIPGNVTPQYISHFPGQSDVKTSDTLTKQENITLIVEECLAFLLRYPALNLMSVLLRPYLAARSDLGRVPKKITDGKSCLSAASPWPDLEKPCWAEQSADLA